MNGNQNTTRIRCAAFAEGKTIFPRGGLLKEERTVYSHEKQQTKPQTPKGAKH